jgi:hypothetical protein
MLANARATCEVPEDGELFRPKLAVRSDPRTSFKKTCLRLACLHNGSATYRSDIDFQESEK